MMEKIKQFIRTHFEGLSYLFFGGLTTVVNYLVYFPCLHWLHWSAAVSNAVSWVVAVAFAFVTNKPFVFKSHDWSFRVVLAELVKFVGCRLGSGLLETVILAITVDFLHMDGNLWKVFTSVIVVLVNYFASKLLVFQKGEKKQK